MSPSDRKAVNEILSGVDIDAIHRTWPHQRGLFRKQRRLVGTEGWHSWVMLALAVGCLIGWALGRLG